MTERIAVAAVVLLYVLHQDFWFWHQARPLVFGCLPIGLFYHAAHTVASAGALWLLVKYAWPSHLEDATHLTTTLPGGHASRAARGGC